MGREAFRETRHIHSRLLLIASLFMSAPAPGANAQDFPAKTWNTEVLGQIGSEIGATRVRVVGNLLYVADGRNLAIYDVSEPASPRGVGRVYLDYPAMDLSVSGGIACVALRYYGVKIVDVSEPRSPWS